MKINIKLIEEQIENGGKMKSRIINNFESFENAYEHINEKFYKEYVKGITLIALVVTIVVLLILAGVSLNLVLGNNGIIRKGLDAKEATKIENEKDQIALAYNGARDYINATITRHDFENELRRLAGDTVEVEEDGNEFIVFFTDSGRYYKVYKDGNINDFKIHEDSTPGVLAQDENGNFMLESIEDLVTFSAMVNGGYSDANLSIESNQFDGETIVLMCSLNFESNRSYKDSTTTRYNGYLGIEDNTVTLMEALTEDEYEGFIPIGTSEAFCGTFDGNNYSIKNLHMNIANASQNIAFFGNTNNGDIKNLTLTGNIKIENEASVNVGGIVGTSRYGNIENCTSEVIIDTKTQNYIGGIAGYKIYGEVNNCINNAEVKCTNQSWRRNRRDFRNSFYKCINQELQKFWKYKWRCSRLYWWNCWSFQGK